MFQLQPTSPSQLLTPISPASPNIFDPPSNLSFLSPIFDPTPPGSPSETRTNRTLPDSTTFNSTTTNSPIRTPIETRAQTPLLDEPEDQLQFPPSFPADEPSATQTNDINLCPLNPQRPNHKRRHNNINEFPLEKQRRREYFSNKAKRVRKPGFNQDLNYQLRPQFSNWRIIFWDTNRQEYTIENPSLKGQRLTVPLKAITAFPT